MSILKNALDSIHDEDADYIIGSCIPLLQILLHEGDEQAKEVLKEISSYCGIEENGHI